MRQYIHESNLIEGIDDPREDEQSWEAWQWLEKQDKIDRYVILRVQKSITINQPLRPDQRGYFRDLSRTNVTVGGHRTPDWAALTTLMNDWVENVERYSPLENHIEFERIHPFVDGNGRTGRMLMWWQEIQEGQKPTLFKADERHDYYKLFKESKNGQ